MKILKLSNGMTYNLSQFIRISDVRKIRTSNKYHFWIALCGNIQLEITSETEQACDELKFKIENFLLDKRVELKLE